MGNDDGEKNISVRIYLLIFFALTPAQAVYKNVGQNKYCKGDKVRDFACEGQAL